MDEETLTQLAPLLSGAVGASTRAATCTAIAGVTSGASAASQRELIGSCAVGSTILRRLVILCDDSHCARLALSALINLTESASATAATVRAGAVERATHALVDNSPLAELWSGLLSNVTRHAAGVDAVLGRGLGDAARATAVDRLLKLVVAVDRVPNVLWLSNVCASPHGRAALLLPQGEGDRQPLTWVLRLLDDERPDRRLAAASALRNCAMAPDTHAALVEKTNAVGVCLARLVGRGLLPEKVKTAPPEVRQLVAEGRQATESVVEIRRMFVESLLLCCKSRVGRDGLRNRAAYEVLDVWAHQETDPEIKSEVGSILDRLAAMEEGEQLDMPSNISIVQTNAS